MKADGIEYEERMTLLELLLKVRASDLMAHFEGRGAKLYLPRGDRDYAFDVGLRMLALILMYFGTLDYASVFASARSLVGNTIEGWTGYAANLNNGVDGSVECNTIGPAAAGSTPRAAVEQYA